MGRRAGERQRRFEEEKTPGRVMSFHVVDTERERVDSLKGRTSGSCGDAEAAANVARRGRGARKTDRRGQRLNSTSERSMPAPTTMAGSSPSSSLGSGRTVSCGGSTQTLRGEYLKGGLVGGAATRSAKVRSLVEALKSRPAPQLGRGFPTYGDRRACSVSSGLGNCCGKPVGEKASKSSA